MVEPHNGDSEYAAEAMDHPSRYQLWQELGFYRALSRDEHRSVHVGRRNGYLVVLENLDHPLSGYRS